MSPGYRLTVIAFGLLAAVLVTACQDNPDHSTKSPEEVVVHQLAAIRRGEFEEAFKHAAEQLRNKFSAETFGIMIRNGYPSLVDSTSDEIVGVDSQTSIASVLLKVSASSRAPTFYRYDLVREDGGWKIAGVDEVDAPFV